MCLHISKLLILSVLEMAKSFFMLVRLFIITPFILIFTTPCSKTISFWLHLSKYLYEYGIQIDFLGNSPISLLWIFTRFHENTFAGSDWFMAVESYRIGMLNVGPVSGSVLWPLANLTVLMLMHYCSASQTGFF